MPRLPNRKAGVLRKIVIKKSKELKIPESTTWPQTVTFKYDVLPEAKNWKNGEMYYLKVCVEQMSSTKDSVTFEINKVASMPEDVGPQEAGSSESGEGD
jgi:hypothetical protein